MDALPNEILTEIFHILTIVDRPVSRPPWSMRPDVSHRGRTYLRVATRSLPHVTRNWVNDGHPGLAWVNITYVCHRWRECALQTSSLWTYLPNAAVLGPRWIEIFIERGREAGIHYADNYLPMDGVELLSRHIHHIGILHLNYTDDRAKEYIDVLQRPMPLVTELSLRNFDLADLRSDLPRLRHLRLYNTILRAHHLDRVFTSNIALFEFSIGAISTRRSMTQPTANLLAVFEALRRMPRLRSLSLTLDAADDTGTQQLPLVELRSLTRMSISGESAILHFVLKRVVFPPSTSLRIAPRAVPIPVPDFMMADEQSNLAFVRFYEELVRDSALAPFCTIEVNTQMKTLYFAAARHRFPDVSLAKPPYDLELELPVVDEEKKLGLTVKLLSRFCKNKSVRQLYIAGACSPELAALFYDMSEVVHIDLMGPSVALLVFYMTAKKKLRSSPDEKQLGDNVETLALHRGHVDRDQCNGIAIGISSSTPKDGSRKITVCMAKANLSLVGRTIWEEAGVEVVGV